MNRLSKQFGFIADERQAVRMFTSSSPDFVALAARALPVFMQGLMLGFGLIVAIGAQNAFVLRQGLRGEHVRAVVLFCGVADCLLIAVGVLGMSQVLAGQPGLARALAWSGAAFLLAYGCMALRRAARTQRLEPAAAGRAMGRGAVLAQAAAFTLLNPHVYIDTVVLVGSIGAQHPGGLRGWFIAGAGTASLLWFHLLGHGARRLAPWFARPGAWRMLDAAVGVTMWVLAALLLRQAVSMP